MKQEYEGQKSNPFGETVTIEYKPPIDQATKHRLNEKTYDSHILVAYATKSTQLDQITDWINHSFEFTGYTSKATPLQAFNIATYHNKTFDYNLTSTEINNIKYWATEKSKIWQKEPNSIRQDLQLVSDTSPELIKKISIANDSKSLRNIVEKIIQKLPGKENFHIQELIFQYFFEKEIINLESIQTVVDNIENIRYHSMSDKDIWILMENTKIPEKPKIKKNKKLNNQKPDQNSEKNIDELTETKERLKIQKTENERLRNEIEKIEKKLKDLKNKKSIEEVIETNWISYPKYHLSDKEKLIMYFLLTNKNVFELGRKLDLTKKQIEELINSALTKKLTFDWEEKTAKTKN